MGWRCRNCYCNVFDIEYIMKRSEAKLDKYQNIITFSELDEEIEQFVCHNCENSSEDLEDIAEWSEL